MGLSAVSWGVRPVPFMHGLFCRWMIVAVLVPVVGMMVWPGVWCAFWRDRCFRVSGWRWREAGS